MSMLDLIMIFPTGFSASFLKIIKGKLTPGVAEYIDKNKLYHFIITKYIPNCQNITLAKKLN